MPATPDVPGAGPAFLTKALSARDAVHQALGTARPLGTDVPVALQPLDAAAPRPPSTPDPAAREVTHPPAPAESSTGSYSPLAGFRKAIESRLGLSESKKIRPPAEASPTTIVVKPEQLSERSNVDNIIGQLNANLELVIGGRNASGEAIRGYVDDTVLEVRDALQTADDTVRRLTESYIQNQGAMVRRVEQRKTGRKIPAKADMTSAEKVQWAAAQDADKVQQRRGKALKPNEKTDPKTAPQKDVEKDEIIEVVIPFDPEQAAPVKDAKARLDKAQADANKERQAADDYFRQNIPLAERETVRAICEIFGLLRSGTGSLRGEVKTDIEDIARNHTYASLVEKGGPNLEQVSGRITLTDADRLQLGLKPGESPTLAQIIKYVNNRKGERNVQEAEALLARSGAFQEQAEKVDREYQAAKTEAKKWEVDGHGNLVGSGYGEYGQALDAKNGIIRNLGDVVQIDMYLGTSYLGDLRTGSREGTEQEIITQALLRYQKAKQEIEGYDRQVKALTKSLDDPDLIAAREGNRKAITDVSNQRAAQQKVQEDALEQIRHTINPADRLAMAPAMIRGENIEKVKHALEPMGLGGSNEQIRQQQERVAQAFEQALKEIPTGKVPDERALVAKVIQILQGDKSQLELVSGNTASPSPARPEVPPSPTGPAAPEAVGAAEVTAGAAAETATAEQAADAALITGLNSLTDAEERTLCIMDAKQIVVQLAQPEFAGADMAVAELLSKTGEDQKGLLERYRANMEARPMLKPVVKLFEILDKLGMKYEELINIGKRKDPSTNGIGAAAVGIMLILQGFEKFNAEALGAAQNQTETH